jgi:hypothetical protein
MKFEDQIHAIFFKALLNVTVGIQMWKRKWTEGEICLVSDHNLQASLTH